MPPRRTCIICRKKSNKANLLRIVKNKLGKVQLDPGQLKPGRGMYVCKNPDCGQKLVDPKKIGALKHHLKLQVLPEGLVEELGLLKTL